MASCVPEERSLEPRLVLTGMFTYMADAASITLCADGGRLPVAMEADYKALEAAYLKERQQPGQALLVSLEGLIALRPSVEANRPPWLRHGAGAVLPAVAREGGAVTC